MNSLLYSNGRIGAGLALVIITAVTMNLLPILLLFDLYGLIQGINLILGFSLCTGAIQYIWKKNGWF